MPIFDELPDDAYVRGRQIYKPDGKLPIGKSTWEEGVNDGRYPKGIKLGPGIRAYRVGDIRKLIKELAEAAVMLIVCSLTTIAGWAAIISSTVFNA